MVVNQKGQKTKSAQLIGQTTRNMWLTQQDYQVLKSLVLMPGVSLDRPDSHASPFLNVMPWPIKLAFPASYPGWVETIPAKQTYAQLRVLAARAKWQ